MQKRYRGCRYGRIIEHLEALLNDPVFSLPPNLPEPEDDGLCSHLQGMPLPSVPLQATTGDGIDLSLLPGRLVIYCYPATGKPGVPLPTGWDEMPGARGCTPQACAFRDHQQELQARGAAVYGISGQTTLEQQEAATRLHLPFPLLSDADFRFTEALQLPTFMLEGKRYLKRVTLITIDGFIEKVFYPVFPPDKNAQDVLVWFAEH
jgi:peroxiredoxin